MLQPTVTILIPCLNEERTILGVIDNAKISVRKYFPRNCEIIIADNGSTDGTLDVIHKVKGVRLVKVPIRGYGAALHWGIMNAKGDYVLFADADSSYPFSNISKFKGEIKKSPDLVLGSRFKGKITKGAMPVLHRYFGTPLLTFLIRLIYGIPTTDCNSGMRMVKRSFYKKLNMRNSGMEWASELLLKTAINKGDYIEVPIVYKKDKRTKSPNLNTWADGWRHLKSIFLLKPESLFFFLFVFIAAAIFFKNISFAITFLFLDLAVVLSLSLLTLMLLQAVIEKKSNVVSKILSRFLLVPVSLIFSSLIGILIVVVPDYYLGTKLFLVSILGIIFMWIFLVETIKTHLVNRLPDVK